jgi:hypothetical protein
MVEAQEEMEPEEDLERFLMPVIWEMLKNVMLLRTAVHGDQGQV